MPDGAISGTMRSENLSSICKFDEISSWAAEGNRHQIIPLCLPLINIFFIWMNFTINSH